MSQATTRNPAYADTMPTVNSRIYWITAEYRELV